MALDVAEALARLGARGSGTGDDDLVFRGEGEGGHLDGRSMRRRYDAAIERAGLRPLRFHDLRHTFGTSMIAVSDIRRVQARMGHVDIQTTMRYLHYGAADRGRRARREGVPAVDAGRRGRGSRDVVPRVSFFHGIAITMRWDEGVHAWPHSHARASGRKASFAFDGSVIVGELTRHQVALEEEWTALHAEELQANWARTRRNEPLLAIDPFP